MRASSGAYNYRVFSAPLQACHSLVQDAIQVLGRFLFPLPPDFHPAVELRSSHENLRTPHPAPIPARLAGPESADPVVGQGMGRVAEERAQGPYRKAGVAREPREGQVGVEVLPNGHGLHDACDDCASSRPVRVRNSPHTPTAAEVCARRRAEKLTPERRTEIARKAALTRWRKEGKRKA